MTKVKICRINDIRTAVALGALGVDYIGVHLIGGASDDQLASVGELTRACCAPHLPKPVLVMKHLTLEQVVRSANEITTPLIQLHDEWTRFQVRTIREHICREIEIIVTVDPIRGANQWAMRGDLVADYLLFDRIEGGTGRTLTHSKLNKAVKSDPTIPFFIAGGLDEDNVAKCIQEYEPFGVDVQTALEIPGRKGQKDIRKVIQFMASVRGGYGPAVASSRISAVSLSLTDLPVPKIAKLESAVVDSADTVHLDEADGTISKRFVRRSVVRARELHAIFPMKPYDVHVFVAPLTSHRVGTAIEGYKEANPFLRAVFCYVDPRDDTSPTLALAECREVAHKKGVAFGVCLQARPLSGRIPENTIKILQRAAPDHVSIVGPSARASNKLYAARVGSFCRFLRREMPNGSEITLDRSITVGRLLSVIGDGATNVVAGKSIWKQESPQEAILSFKRVLARAALTK